MTETIGYEYIVDVGQARREAEREAVNRAAVFLPMTEDAELPCIEIGGVQVYAYKHRDGALRVALHFDTAEAEVWGPFGTMTPVKVDVGGTIVYGIDANGVES